VLGGFSQGAVMSYALGLGKDRPRPARIVALSGFVPVVPGYWEMDEELDGYPVAIGHGSADPIIELGFAREARERLEEAGADVIYRESPVAHTLDPDYLPELREFVNAAF
jgi:phospholipase/carboxylesterase